MDYLTQKCNFAKIYNTMTDIFLIISCSVAIILLFFFWFAKQSIKSGLSKDENKNNIPDSWEKKIRSSIQNKKLYHIDNWDNYWFVIRQF